MAVAWKQWEGQIVGDSFRLEQFLGEGGNGAVFLTGYGDGEPQPAAIKLFPADTGDADWRLSCLQQAAGLSHPNLIRIFQVGTCRANALPLHYCVMELADENLGSVLLERPLTVAEVREMLGPALDALAYLHGGGFVHGHLKPANIMAAGDQLKLSSDGVFQGGAFLAGSRTRGPYDPPEFEAEEYWPPADVWSLGVTLVQVLTQRMPNPVGGALNLVVREACPDVLRRIVGDCLQPDPRRRATVADLSARFRHDDLRPPAPPAAAAAKKTARGNRFLLPVTLSSLLFGGVFMVSMYLSRSQPAAEEVTQPVSESVPDQRLVVEKLPVTPRPEPPLQAVDSKPEPARQVVADTPEPPPKKLSRRERAAAKRAAAAAAAAAARPVPVEEVAKPSGGSTGGPVIRRAMPEIPPKVRNTIRGSVRVNVRVHVSASGRVESAELANAGPSKYFADLTLRAARQWEFQPAAGQWILQFLFTRTTSEVTPVRASN